MNLWSFIILNTLPSPVVTENLFEDINLVYLQEVPLFVIALVANFCYFAKYVISDISMNKVLNFCNC